MAKIGKGYHNIVVIFVFLLYLRDQLNYIRMASFEKRCDQLIALWFQDAQLNDISLIHTAKIDELRDVPIAHPYHLPIYATFASYSSLIKCCAIDVHYIQTEI